MRLQNIDDLKEIVRAMQELGNAWYTENISLREANAKLSKDNEQLRAENESLRREFDNLSEKVTVLKNELRGEILNELNAAEQETFQKLVKDYLGDIRKKLNVATVKTAEPSLYQGEIQTSAQAEMQEVNEAPIKAAEEEMQTARSLYDD